MKSTILYLFILFITIPLFAQDQKCECYSKSGITEKIGIGGYGMFKDYTDPDERQYHWYAAYFPSEELCYPRDNYWWQEVQTKIADAVEFHPVYYAAKKQMPEMYREKPMVANQADIRQSDIDRVIKTAADQGATLLIIDVDLASFARPLQRCADIKEEDTNSTSQEISDTSKSTSSSYSSSTSSKKESKKVMTREEYEKSRLNISNYKFSQRVKELEIRGYSSGQAQVMADYERDNRNNKVIVEELGNALGGVLADIFDGSNKRINNAMNERWGDQEFEKQGKALNQINKDDIAEIRKKYASKNIPDEPDDIKQFIMEYYLLFGNRSYYSYGAIVQQRITDIYFEGDKLRLDFEIKTEQGIDDNNHLGGYSSRNHVTIKGQHLMNIKLDKKILGSAIKPTIHHERFNADKAKVYNILSFMENYPNIRANWNSYDIKPGIYSLLSQLEKPDYRLIDMFDKFVEVTDNREITVDDLQFDQYLKNELPRLDRVRNKDSERIEPVICKYLSTDKKTIALMYVLDDRYIYLTFPISNFEGTEWLTNNDYKTQWTNAPLSYYSSTHKGKNEKIDYKKNTINQHIRLFMVLVENRDMM
ncbi:hypothetical protein AAU57_13745 [Nonlabens sp. YIK11]|uniref:hypothetical protein n=1 Tax=Nonlabens sp. YIK11 TaxID=1453349 RepID=UPI0006DC7518|nr:hypothetical protein [Nonlabens sp. YIK11]KQC34281.1 hypothetical protein AAU57_13745 [Nonlabens sp. YIK11]